MDYHLPNLLRPTVGRNGPSFGILLGLVPMNCSSMGVKSLVLAKNSNNFLTFKGSRTGMESRYLDTKQQLDVEHDTVSIEIIDSISNNALILF